MTGACVTLIREGNNQDDPDVRLSGRANILAVRLKAEFAGLDAPPNVPRSATPIRIWVYLRHVGRLSRKFNTLRSKMGRETLMALGEQ
jgi:hypothetical protein